VSAAGITANIIFAFVALLLLRLISPEPSGMAGQVLLLLAHINIILAAFNLIPIRRLTVLKYSWDSRRISKQGTDSN